MAQDVVDIEDLILKWALKYELEPDLQRLRKKEISASDINWKYFNVSHEKTVYAHEHQTKGDEAKTHVIFNSVFRNSTSDEQTYHFRAERKTQSTCCIQIIKGFSVGGSLQIKIVPPNPVLQANAGFRADLNITKARGETFTESLTWSIDSDVRVKEFHKMDANLVIRESNYKGDFTIRSRFDGRVVVLIRNKKDDSPLAPISAPLKEILTSGKGFTHDKTGVYFTTSGSCQCTFGIEQQVKLKQLKLKDAKKKKKKLRKRGLNHEGGDDDDDVAECADIENGQEDDQEESEDDSDEEEEEEA